MNQNNPELIPIEEWEYCHVCNNTGIYIFPFHDVEECDCIQNPKSVYSQTRLAYKLAKCFYKTRDNIIHLRSVSQNINYDQGFNKAINDILKFTK